MVRHIKFAVLTWIAPDLTATAVFQCLLLFLRHNVEAFGVDSANCPAENDPSKVFRYYLLINHEALFSF